MKRVFAFLLLGVLTFLAFGGMLFFYSQNLGKGALQVTSNPTSKVYLDGKLLGTTPLCEGAQNCTIKEGLPQGEHVIRLVPTEGKFSPFEHKISINPKVLTVVDRNFNDGTGASGSVVTLSPIDKDSIALEVISFPVGAKVFLDSDFVGDSPLLDSSVTQSDHELKLTKDGYNDKVIPIRTAKGYKLDVQVFLSANPQASPSASAPVLPVALDRSKLSIFVENGSGIPGAAANTAGLLRGLGYNVVSTGNADAFVYNNLTIKLKDSQKSFLDTLKKDLSSYTIASASADLDSSFSSDALVIVGK